MTQPVSDALAELIAMKASGEITLDEFNAARDRLRSGARAPSGGGYGASASSPAAGSDAAVTPRPSSARTKDGDGAAAVAETTPKKKSRLRQVIGLLIAFVLTVVVLAFFGGGTVYKRADYGDAWPYPKFDRATVRCKVRRFGTADRPVVTIELGGVTYGLNGAALGVGGYPNPRSLEAPDRTIIAGTQMTMIADALSNLCRWRQ